MKRVFLLVLLVLTGCKAATKSGEKSYFGTNHSPYLDAPSVFIAAEEQVEQTSITLDWADSKGADEYILSYKEMSHAAFTEVARVKTSRYKMTGLRSNTGYDFKISAKNKVGITDSNIISMRTLAGASNPGVASFSTTTMTEGVQTVVTLPYSQPGADKASSCEVSHLVNVDVTQACQCDAAGICTVGVTPNNLVDADGSFKYKVLIGQYASNESTVSFRSEAVNHSPTISTLSSAVTDEDMPITMTFSIHDADSTLACNSSFLSVSSSNLSLLDPANVTFGGTYPNCTASFTPVQDAHGVTTLSISVSDGAVMTTSNSMTWTVSPVNDSPVVSLIAAMATDENTPKSAAFTVSDVDSALTCAGSVTAVSSNSSLVSTAHLVVSGTAPNCLLTVTPEQNQNGTSVITLSVTDGVTTTTNSFNLTINAINTAPAISFIANSAVNEDAPAVLHFTLSDVDSSMACTASYLSAVSSNASVLLDMNIVFGGTYPNCTATLSPLADASGTTNITFTVNDGELSTVSNAWTLTVNAVNDAPEISHVMAQAGLQDIVKNVSFTINDIDSSLTCSGNVTAASSNATILPSNAIVISGTYPNCQAALTPVTGKSGLVDITLTVSDGSLSNVSAFAYSITSVNQAPTISAVAGTAFDEDTPAVISFTINDSDSTLTCSSANLSMTSTNPALISPTSVVFGGTFPNCTATVTPVLDQNGSASVAISVTDGVLTTATPSFTLTVNSVNDVAVIAPVVTQNMGLNAPAVVAIHITDVDSVVNCGTTLSGTSSNTALVPDNAIAFTGIAPACIATVTPVLNQTGITSITITADDGSGTASSSFTLTFGLSATAPVATNITQAAFNEDTQSMITLNYNSNVALAQACFISTPSHVTVTSPCSCDVNGVCKVGVTGTANYNGSAGFLYSVTANSILSNSANATLVISPVNDAPVINPVSAQSTTEDTPKVVNFTISDIDSTLTCAGSVTTLSSNATLVDSTDIVIAGTAPNCSAAISPKMNQADSSNITLIVSDGLLSAQTTFALTVTPVNDAPEMAALSAQSGSEDTTAEVNFDIHDADSVVSCTGSVTGTSSNQSIVKNSKIIFGGTYPHCTASVSPEANQSGAVTVTLAVTDGTLTDSKNFVLTFAAVNDAPAISVIAAQTTNEDTVKAVNFTIGDIDSAIDCSNVSAASASTTVIPLAGIIISGTYPNCTATITPALNQSGSSLITLTVSDNSLTAQSSFNLTVNAVNNAPSIAFMTNTSTNEDAAKVMNFTIEDVDSTIACSASYLSAVSSNVSLVASTDVAFSGTYPNCTATISPMANQYGSTNITISVSDGSVTTSSNAFTLTVNAVNDAPSISTVMAQSTDEDTAKSISFTVNDIDSTLTCSGSVSGTSSNQLIVLNSAIVISGTYPNCSASVTPVANMNGAVNITLTVNDGSLSDSTTFSMTVAAVNDAPTISAITNQTMNEDGSLVVNFQIADIDSVLTCTGRVSAGSSNTALVPAANIVIGGTFPNCSATITSLTNMHGSSVITLSVTDGALSASSPFTLNVTNVDDAPVATNVSSAVISEDGEAFITLPYTDIDGDQATSCSVSALNKITLSTPCACTAGVCRAGVTGLQDYFGAAGFSFTVTSNGAASNTATASFNISAVNDAPVISAITGKSVEESAALAVSFTISDVDSTLTCSGSVTGSSSNTTVLANSGIVISGSAPNCTATLTPVALKNGSVNITLNVTDGQLTASRTFALTVVPVLNIGGGLITSGIAEAGSTKVIDFTGLTLDEAVSKVEVCISEDTNLDGNISAGEECNTQTWLDVTAVIGASGTSTASWTPYVIKNGKDGASFITSLAPSCSSNRNYMTGIKMTNASGVSTTVVSASWNFWSPTCISNRIGLWLDAADSATMFSNTNCTTPSVSGVANGVNCWKDKSINGYNYNATLTTFPKFQNNGWSGNRPAVMFAGVNDLYKAGIGLTPRNIISAVKVNVNDNLDGLIGNTTADFGVRINDTNSWLSTGLLGLTGDFTYSGGASYINGSTGAAHALKEHILYVSKGDNTFATSVTWTSVGIGGYMNVLGIPDRRINANVGEIIMCTTDCSGFQQRLEGYIAHKWGMANNLPANHPFKTMAP